MNEDKLSQFTKKETGVQSFQSSQMQDEITRIKEEALSSTIEGLHFPETPSTSLYKPNDQSNPYEIQKEALSKINLLDNSLQPTDTYTNYINKGNTPIPGLESQHDTLLFLDRQSEKMKEVEQGTLTEDQMLWDLYGADILEAQGYNVRSVGWWQNKYYNNDFTSPLDNRYLTNLVTEKAREYHNSLLAKKYANDTKVSQSKMNTLLSKGDLSNEDIKSLFPELAKAIEETQHTKDYDDFITSGQVDAQSRIYTTETGERYYLHTDGELYKLSNTEQGSKVASYQEAEDGSLKSISINGSDALDLLQSTKAGASSILSGLGKLVAGLWGATGGWIIDGVTTGDWDWVDSVQDSTNWLDSQLNDNMSWLFDSYYVDMDGFQMDDMKDWGMALTYTGGAMISGVVTGGIAAKAAGWGATLASKGTTAASRFAGKALQTTMNLYARSTGLYKGYVPKETVVKLGAWSLSSAHAKTVTSYFLKDMASNLQTLSNQRTQFAIQDYMKNPDAYDPSKWNNQSWSIFGHSLANASFNAAISMVLAGGIDDNQTQRWAQVLTRKDKLGNINVPSLAKHFMKHRIAYNTVADFLDNSLTMYSSAVMGYNQETGSIEWLRNAATYDSEGNYTGVNWGLATRIAVQAGIQTIPTLKSNLQGRNIAGENIVAIGDAWLKKLNDIEAKAANPEAKQIIQTVRADYLADIESVKEITLTDGSKVAPSAEQRIAYALDQAQSKLQNSAIPATIDEICNPITLQVYKEANDLITEEYNKYLNTHVEQETEIKTKGIKAIKSILSERIKHKWTMNDAAKRYQDNIDNIEHFVDSLYNQYLTLTDSKESATIQERIADRIKLTAEMLDNVEETHMTYRSLTRKHKDIKDKAYSAADTYAKAYGIDSAESVLAASKFYRFKHESNDRDGLNAERAAMTFMTKSTPYAVYQIDDNTFGMVALDNEISKLFHQDTAAKFSMAMHGLGKGDAETKQASIDLMITTLLGDKAADNFKRGKYNKAATKETVEEILNTAINQKVITKKQAAEVIVQFTETDSEIGKQLSHVFESNINTKNVNNLKNLSPLEKYTLIYESINHLANPDNKRFSGKTIAAQAMLQQGYDDITMEVLDDMKGMLPKSVQEYYIKAKEAQLFPLATDSIKQHLTNVIGEKGLAEFKDVSDVETYLRSLGSTASEASLKKAAQDLMDCLDLLKDYKSINYDGNSVTLDLSAWSNKQYRDMIKEIQNTDVSSRKSRQSKESYEGMSEYRAEEMLEINQTYKGKNITIQLTDDNMDSINTLYDLLVKGGFIDPSYSLRPTNAEEMKNILAKDLDDNGRIFANYKNNTEFDTKIISDKESKLIQEKLRTFSTEDLIDTVTVIDPRKGSEIQYNYYTILGSNIQINKISEKMTGLMRRNKSMPIYINPVNIATLGTEKNGAPIFVKYDENAATKQGRAASLMSSTQKAINSHAEAAMVNKDLATTMMMNSYIDFVLENPSKLNIVVPAEYQVKLQELGIIDTEESFYRSTPTFSTFDNDANEEHFIRLELKENVSKQAIEYYLLHDENPNIFKILPFVSDKGADFSIPFVAPGGHKLNFAPDLTGGLSTDYTGLYEILNIKFDYDQTGKLKDEFMKQMFAKAQDGSFEWNPYSEMRKPISIESLDEYIEYRVGIKEVDEKTGKINYKQVPVKDGINDPYYDLIQVYKDLNEKYIAADGEENDDYKRWLKNGNVLKKMIKNYKGKADSKFVADIIKTYAESTPIDDLVGYLDAGYHYSDISTASRFNTDINMVADTAMSKDLLDASIGIDYQLVDVDGNAYKGAEDDIIKAFKYVKNNINDFNQLQEIVNSPYIGSEDYILYRASDATTLWSILSAAEGKVTIEDLDRLVRLEADAYNEFFAKLGMESGYGAKLKTKIDSMYDKLKKLIVGSDTIRHRISNITNLQSRTQGAAIREDAYNVPINIRSKADKQRLNRLGKDYVVEELDTPQITSQRLVDVMADKAEHFRKTFNDTFTERDQYTSAVYNQLAKTHIDDNNDFRRQSLIADISSDINLGKMASTTKNTHESLVANLIQNPNKDLNQKLIDYSALLTQRMSGTRYLTNYAKYSFLDLNTGEEYAMANIQKINGNVTNVDLLLTMFDDNKTTGDWVGKAFITLDKHDGDNPAGLNYSYKVLETETDVINLRNDIMLQVIKENEWNMNNATGKDVREKFLSMSNTEQTNFMNKIIAEGIGIRDKERLLDNVLAKTNINERWKYKFLPVDYKGDINKATIRDIMGTNISALYSSDEGTRKIAHAIIFGIDYDGFDQEHKVLVDQVFDTLRSKLEETTNANFISKNNHKINDIEYRINIGEKLTQSVLDEYKKLYDVESDLLMHDTDAINPDSSIIKAIKKYLIRNSHNSEVLDYFCNSKKSLLKRFTEYKHGYSDTYIIKTVKGSNNEISVKDIRNFYSGVTSNISKTIMFDTEGSNKIKASGETADNIRDLFQISFITDEMVNGKLVSKQETYFIKHDTDFAKWVEENIDYNDNFYRNHVDYQKSVEQYKNLTGNEDNVITEQQVFDILNGKNTKAPDLLIAYNGDNYEFRILKEGLDENINTMDAMQAVMKRESDTTKSIAQDPMYKQYKRNFGEDYSDERHTADQDTKDMREMLVEDYFKSDYAISEDRSKLIKDILHLIPEEYNDITIGKLFSMLDKNIHEDVDLKPILDNFNNYAPTLDNIKELQRSYNYLSNNARGNVFFKLREQLGYDTVYGRLVGDNTSKYNFVDVLATKMLETEGDADKAINFMWANYRDNMLKLEEQPSTQDFVEKLMTKDEETLRVLGIDESLSSNEDVINYKRELIGQFKQGLKGFDEGKIFNISKNVARDFRETEYLTSYITAAETLALENKSLLDEDSLNLFAESLAKNVISVSENFDPKNFKDWLDSSITYDDAGVEALKLEIKNLINKNRGTGTFRGLYSMMGSIDPVHNELIEIDPVTLKAKGSLTKVAAGDIVITTRALRELLNVYDVEDLATYDDRGKVTGYYLLSVTNPADNMNSILPMRVRLIEDNEHITVGFTPETQEILRNRDFDGDHTITTVIPKGMKEMVPLLNDYIFNTYTAYSNIARALSKQDTNHASLKNAYIQKIGSNKDVIALGLKLDTLLSKHSKDIELSNDTKASIKSIEDQMLTTIKNSAEFKNAAMRLNLLSTDEKNSFADSCVKTLSMTETFTNTEEVYRYVNNPSIFNYKKVDGTNTFTHTMRKAMFSRQALTASNLLDPTIGWYQKLLSAEDMAVKNITNPLQDLYTPSIYLTSSLSSDIDAEIKGYNSFSKYLDTVYKYIKAEVTDQRFSNADDFKDYIDRLKDININTTEQDLDAKNYADKAKVLTMQALWDLELYSKKDLNVNNKFLKAMNSIAQDDSFSNQLKVTKDLDDKLQQLTGKVNTLASKKNSHTPLADMLLNTEVNNLIGSEPEDSHIILKDDISNGANKVNVFITKGFLGNAPDDIAQTKHSKASAASFEILDTTKDTYDKNILKPNTPIKKGTVIGHRIINGEKKVIKAKDDMYVNTYYDDGILVNYKHSLEGKKIGGQGLFKGIVTERQTLKGEGAENIDFIIDANNSTKNFNKYSQGLDLATLWQNAEEVTFKDASGRSYEGIVLKDVPFNIIGDDLSYTQKLGLNDPSNIRRFEVMASDGAYSLLGLGRYGSTVLKGNSKDGFYLDFTEISKALKQNQGNHDVTWADAGSMIMYLRSAALVNAMTEDEFIGLMNANNSKEFKSRKEYLENLRTSPEKVNSEALVQEQNKMIRLLNKDRYLALYKSSNLMSYIFGSEVNSKLNPMQPSTFSDEFYKDPKSPHSNASGKAEMSRYGVNSQGTYISPSSRDVNGRNLIQSSYLHIPFDQFYRGTTGRYLDQNDMIRAIQNGVIGYTKHFDNSAMIENDFTPVDINMGTRLKPVTDTNVVSGVVKTAIGGEADIFKPTNTTMIPFQKGSGTHDVFYGYEDPTKPTFGSMMSKAMDIGHQLTSYDKKTKIGYMMAVAFDQNKNNLERMGILKGKDSVIANKLTSQFVNDKDKIGYVRIHDNKKVSLAEAQKYINEGTKGYMLRKDVKDSIDKHQFTVDEMRSFKKSGILEADTEMNEKIREANKQKAIAYKNLVASLENINSDITKNDIKFTWDVSNSTEEYKNSLWTRSGISVENADQLSVDVGIKNYIADSEYRKREAMGYLDTLKQHVAKVSSKEFEDFAKFRWLQAAASSDPKGYETRAKYMGVKELGDSSTLKAAHDKFVKENPDTVKAYENYIDRVMSLAKEASQIRNEPFDSYYLLFAPYISRNKEVRYNTTYSNIKTMMGLNKYDPVSRRNALEQNMMFDFFKGSERIIGDLSKAIAAEHISEALLGKYQVGEDGKATALIDNKQIVDTAFEIINAEDTFSDLKTYNWDFNSDVSKEVLDVVSLYTDIDTYRLRKNSKNGNELLNNAYHTLKYEAESLRSQFENETGVPATLSNVYQYAKDLNITNEPTKLLAQKTADTMWAEIIVAQRIIETSSKASTKLVKYIADLESSGYVLVNKFGQKIKRNGEIAPISDASLSYLKENVELTMNSRNETMFAQYVLEKALSGEIYLCRQDLADQLEDKVYTSKVPGRVRKTLTNISKTSAAIQMALPQKLLSRLLRFTGFDYAMGAIGNYETIPNISKAAKELSQAVQSNGKAMTEELKGYLIRQGQPNLGGLPSFRNKSAGLDPINFSDELDDNALTRFTSGMTRPLEFQNHLGRYAIYLTALKSFEEGKPWYGSQYYNHEYIDKLSSNEDKAMYVMDYMLGSHGGFPAITKKTSGLMMYATFPINLTRTGGAYLMSMAKLFQEGVTEENAGQWFNTIIMPSLGMVGISALSNVILSAICEAYGVDEETEEEWKKEGVTLDPLGTLIGGTPSVIYDSTNPAMTLKEMYINPFTNEYNDTLPKKAYGWFKANVLSSLNPALKMPIEIITGQDLWGDNAEGYQTADPLYSTTKKYQYTTLENGMKKVLGYFVGSGVANNIIDQNKIDTLNGESNFLHTLWKGFTKGVNADLGNQKSWKKDTSSYYSFITDIKAYRNSNSDSEYYHTDRSGQSESTYQFNNDQYLSIEDMADADKLEYNRYYASRYGEFDDIDYQRVSATLKKYINSHESSTTIYNYIVKEYNENKVSEATMRAALNNNSLARKLKQLKNVSGYLNTLSTDEKMRLQKALEYEQEHYPILELLFPEDTGNNDTYIPYYKWSGYSGGSNSYPTYTKPRTFNYYPGKYYPKTFYYNKKASRYTGADIDRVSVNVSPQMGIWNQDYNLTRYDTGYTAKNEPKWLRDKGYVNRTN